MKKSMEKNITAAGKIKIATRVCTSVTIIASKQPREIEKKKFHSSRTHVYREKKIIAKSI